MKKNIVFLLILIPIIWISCDGMGHQTIDFRIKVMGVNVID